MTVGADTPRPAHRASWLGLAAVAVGGMLGTGLRLALDLALPHGEFPASTLLANTLGSFALGFVVARLWPRAPAWLRLGLGTGTLGSFTTFSAVAVALVAMGAHGEWMLAFAFLAASLVLGLGAALLGLRWGGRHADAQGARRSGRDPRENGRTT